MYVYFKYKLLFLFTINTCLYFLLAIVLFLYISYIFCLKNMQQILHLAHCMHLVQLFLSFPLPALFFVCFLVGCKNGICFILWLALFSMSFEFSYYKWSLVLLGSYKSFQLPSVLERTIETILLALVKRLQ